MLYTVYLLFSVLSDCMRQIARGIELLKTESVDIRILLNSLNTVLATKTPDSDSSKNGERIEEKLYLPIASFEDYLIVDEMLNDKTVFESLVKHLQTFCA